MVNMKAKQFWIGFCTFMSLLFTLTNFKPGSYYSLGLLPVNVKRIWCGFDVTTLFFYSDTRKSWKQYNYCELFVANLWYSLHIRICRKYELGFRMRFVNSFTRLTDSDTQPQVVSTRSPTTACPQLTFNTLDTANSLSTQNISNPRKKA